MNEKENNLLNIITTLIVNGFHIDKIDRISPSNFIINLNKHDKLGALVKYSILFSNDQYETPIIQTLFNYCKINNSYPIYVNDHYSVDKCDSYSEQKFFEIFGGIVQSGLLLSSNLPEIFSELGHNDLPEGFNGKAEDILELYVCESLQFLTEKPTRRYGIERLFQELPDGVVIGKDYLLLIDSKAYSEGFKFSSDDIKRFASYVNDFNKRYEQFFGKVFSFVVVSSEFRDSIKSISSRSEDLYNQSGCKLSCIKSGQLGKIVQHLQQTPEFRNSIDWRKIFSKTIIELKHVRKELSRIQKDKIL